MDDTYRLPNWDGPFDGPAQGANACALTAAYKRHETLTPDRILQIARNAARCLPQRVLMNGYSPAQALLYHLDAVRRLLIVFPHRTDWDRQPVRVYTQGQMTVAERNSFVADIVGGFIHYLGELEGPGKERAALVSVK